MSRVSQKKNLVKGNDSIGVRKFAADFETTTGSWKTDETKVWSFCVDEVGSYDPLIYGSIEDFFDFCADVSWGSHKRIYFHNLKFDGEFILYHALEVMHMQTALYKGSPTQAKYLKEGEISYLISDMGQWYQICFRHKGVLVEIRDSLKLMPFELREVGKSFCKKYKKTEMEYDDKTSLDDCTEKDIEYIKNDVLVLSEALSFLFQTNGEESPFKPIASMTIGGACLSQFKGTMCGEYGAFIGCHLDTCALPQKSGSKNKDEYIRKAYRGGYCYVNPRFEGQLLDCPGYTMDVNSLYPFVMCYEFSGFSYPVGKGEYETGKPDQTLFDRDDRYFYTRIRCAFELKEGYVPTIQIKGRFEFPGNLYLEKSAAYSTRKKQYVGELQVVELTLSKDDLIVFLEHYNTYKLEYLDHIWFYAREKMFDEYIEEYAKIKQESKGATRSLAKLFSNNLYGQMAKSNNSSYKLVKSSHDGLDFDVIEQHEKKVENIAIGAAITAKARRYQIETIQRNLDHFVYSDTDSLHCIGDPSEFIGRVDDKIYGCYKCEHTWTRGRFVRQKTYIEVVEDGSWNICAAGMTPKQKDRFREENKFEDFRIGLKIKGGKLAPRHVKGGIILEDVDFTIK